MKTAILMILTLNVLTAFGAVEIKRDIASIEHSVRVEHAKELLGTSYRKAMVVNFEKIHQELEKNIAATLELKLPKNYKTQSLIIAKTLITEAKKVGLDPYFLMAVISGESSFNPLARGPVGEIGLMQLRPSTGAWMAKKINFKWNGEKTLRDPVSNIKLGTAYLAWLREKFNNHGQLYLAAYNMGPKSVLNAVAKNVWPKDYPRHVMKRYIAFYKQI